MPHVEQQHPQAFSTGITNYLYSNNIIKSKELFYFSIKLNGGTIQAGEYDIPRGAGVWTIASMLAKNPGNAEINEMKVSVMRSKIMKETELRDAEKEMSHIADIISKTSNPRITVLKSIYPGVWLTINGVTQKLKTENYNIHYQKNGVELEFVPNI